MERGIAKVPCPDCRLTSEAADPGVARWHCPRCGRFYFLRRCSVCGLVSHVSGFQGWHQPWECVWCKATNTGFTQNNDPAAATAGELAEDVAGHDLAFAPPGHVADPDHEPAVVLPGGGRAADRGLAAGPPATPSPDPAVPPGPDRAVASGPDGAVPPGPAETVLPGPDEAVLSGPSHGTAPLPSQFAAASRPPHPWRYRAFAALTVAVILALTVLIALANHSGFGAGPGPDGHQADGHQADGHQAAGSGQASSGGSRAVSVSDVAVGTVDLHAVPGLLTIVGTSADRVTLTGDLHWKGQAPDAVDRLDRATGVLRLSYRCAPASPCTGNYRLAVPDGTATALSLPSGRLVLSGLGGPVRITAASVNVTATGLHSPSLAVAITSGRMTASFSLPPRQVSITLTSAQATLRLPDSTAYRVSQHVTSGSVKVAVPHTETATNTVTAFLNSGDLQLSSGLPG